MSATRLGRTLVIANPASHSGRGASGAEVVRRVLSSYGSATEGFDLWLTEAPGQAQTMAAQAGAYDTVICLGGDGAIHEVVNGLMSLADDERPCLGVIPLGSGNDFARTLGLSLNDPEASLAQLLTGTRRRIDIGHVTSDTCPEGTYFAETLSFGLDAAIAMDTTTRRAEGTRQQGAGLFVTSSLRLLVKARETLSCTVSIDGGGERHLDALLCAVQNGPTYGGGFRICPDAVPDDGLLDLCYNTRRLWLPHLLFLFGLSRFGLHVRSKAAQIRRGKELVIDFDGKEPPCQVDGEPMHGTRYRVEVADGALCVLVPKACPW